MTTKAKPPPLRVFISHCSADQMIASSVVELLKSALKLQAAEIRCTSVEGHRLAIGSPTEETLRKEVREAEAFIALLTPNSLQSQYVFFELGARWGARLHLAPLLANGVLPSVLRAPLNSLNALSCDSEAQLFQLVRDLGQHLKVAPEDASAINGKVRELRILSNESTPPEPKSIDATVEERVDAKLSECLDAKWNEWLERQASRSPRQEEAGN